MNELKVFTNERLGKIRAIEHNGEPYVVTVAGSSLTEAMKQVTLDLGWIFGSYSVLGVTA